MQARTKRCHDCAYRKDSPERQAMDGDRMPYNPNGTFVCHDRLPKAVYYVHPSGAVMEPIGDSYQPIMNGNRAWLADGRPATVCAGWAADNRAYWKGQQ